MSRHQKPIQNGRMKIGIHRTKQICIGSLFANGLCRSLSLRNFVCDSIPKVKGPEPSSSLALDTPPSFGRETACRYTNQGEREEQPAKMLESAYGIGRRCSLGQERERRNRDETRGEGAGRRGTNSKGQQREGK